MCALNHHCEMCARFGDRCGGLYEVTEGRPLCFDEDIEDNAIDYAALDEYEAAFWDNLLKD
jgi:hypothetical protein